MPAWASSPKSRASAGAETSVTATQVILMTVLGLGSLAVVTLLLGSGVCLAVVLVRESKKLDGAVALSERIAALAADTAVARKELNALDEIVATKLNRMATEKKRSVKKQKICWAARRAILWRSGR